MTLNKHFREFIELLEKNEVRFLVVGGYAVGFHGFPRYTGDLDVVAVSQKNAEALVRVFADCWLIFDVRHSGQRRRLFFDSR